MCSALLVFLMAFKVASAHQPSSENPSSTKKGRKKEKNHKVNFCPRVSKSVYSIKFQTGKISEPTWSQRAYSNTGLNCHYVFTLALNYFGLCSGFLAPKKQTCLDLGNLCHLDRWNFQPSHSCRKKCIHLSQATFGWVVCTLKIFHQKFNKQATNGQIAI